MRAYATITITRNLHLNVKTKEDSYIPFNALVSVLQVFARNRKLKEGKLVHSYIIRVGLANHENTYLWNNVLNMYSKCGSLRDVSQVFEKMSNPSVVSWTAIISAYASQGNHKKAIMLFRDMQQCGTMPNNYTLSVILKSCAEASDSDTGRHIHHNYIQNNPGFGQDQVVMNALIFMYCRCDGIDEARQVFDKMTTDDNVSWNAMISGYFKRGNVDEAMHLFGKMPCPDIISWNSAMAGLTHNGMFDEALRLFIRMQFAGIMPDGFSFGSLLTACAGLGMLQVGRQIHSQIVVNGLEFSSCSVTALVDMYAKCTSLDDASKLFNKYTATLLDEPDVSSWNAMVGGYVKNGFPRKALEMFCKMHRRGLPMDHFTFGSVLNGCSSLVDLDFGKQVHALISKAYKHSDVVVGTGFVDLYVKCHQIEDACKVFESIHDKDTITWTSMIVGCALNGWSKAALHYFVKMIEQGISPDKFTYAGALNACSHLAALQFGKQVHALFVLNGFQSDLLVSNALIDLYSKCGSPQEAGIVSIELQKWSLKNHECLQPRQKGMVDVVVGGALIDMYSKCGSVEDAYKLFSKMPKRDVVAWSAMISGFALHGEGRRALELFHEMLSVGIRPNEITLVGVLSACSHNGLVDEGLYYFNSMAKLYNVTPGIEHYSCMVDLLGRAGLLKEAERFIAEMPMKPNASIWGTLLGACMANGDLQLGEQVAERLFELKQHDSSSNVILSNMYSAIGMWDSAGKLRGMMRKRGIKKQPGLSWIEIKNVTYTFVSGNPSGLIDEHAY